LKIGINDIKKSAGSAELVRRERNYSAEAYDGVRLVDEMLFKASCSLVDSARWLLVGQVSGHQWLNCARTNKDFKSPFLVQFKIFVEETSDVAECTVDDSDEEYFTIKHPQGKNDVDFSECFRQLILIEQPMSPVSNPDEDFEWSTEEQSETGSPWDALQKLKERFNN
jgi:uncharacterized metal-binding protein YceD (DUF177 family)